MNVLPPTTKYAYAQLPEYDLQIEDIIADEKYFTDLPDDWWVIVSDIKGSTRAFENNKFREINTVAASSLAIGLAMADRHDITIPYVYGGDGATMIVPSELKDDLLKTLQRLKLNTTYNLNLNLRVGAMSIKEIREAGYRVRVAKFSLDRHYNQAIFTDTGLYYAERKIKDNAEYQLVGSGEVEKADLENIELQWITRYVPADDEQVLCLVIDSTDPYHHRKVYQDVLAYIDRVMGDYDDRHPLFQDVRLAQKVFGPKNLKLLSRVKGVSMWKELPRRLGVMFGLWGKVVDLSTDVIKMDGSLKTILVGNDDHVGQILEYLNEQEAAGRLRYGHTLSRSSIVTSVIEEHPDVYVGLVDVNDGGYTLAAYELKQKMKREQTQG